MSPKTTPIAATAVGTSAFGRAATRRSYRANGPRGKRSGAARERDVGGATRDRRTVDGDHLLHGRVEVEFLGARVIRLTGGFELPAVLDERVDLRAERRGVPRREPEVVVQGEAGGRALGCVRDERGEPRAHGLENRHPLELDLARVDEEVGLSEALEQ